MSAVISECGTYRYILRRSIPTMLRWYRPCLFIMLNPSTADATKDDATIRRCLGFAESWGMTHLTVVNLFAFRATRPLDLVLAADPVGPENDYYLKEEIDKHKNSPIIAAWGAHRFAEKRALELKVLGPFQCLGMTKEGYPRHPLYVKKDVSLTEYTYENHRTDDGARSSSGAAKAHY